MNERVRGLAFAETMICISMLLQGLNMNIFGAIANRLPDYTYSIPGKRVPSAACPHTLLRPYLVTCSF